jgi:hypothetical protein
VRQTPIRHRHRIRTAAMARRPSVVPTMAGRRLVTALAGPVVPPTGTAQADPVVLQGTGTAQADPVDLQVTGTAQADPVGLLGTTARAGPVAHGMGIPSVATSTGSRGVTGPHPGDGVRRHGRTGADRSRRPEGPG